MINLINKTILVSKRVIDNEGIEHFDTFFGTVQKANENTVVVIKVNGQEELIPYDEEVYESAEEGLYELCDGSVCENPDFIAEFLVYQSEEAYKKYQNKHK
jgi:hypothetical protein